VLAVFLEGFVMMCRKLSLVLVLGMVEAAWSSAPATAPNGVKLTPEVYGGYFAKNTFEPDAERSVVVAGTQAQFDAVFGAGVVMGDTSHRLAAGTFDKKVVVAVVRRAKAIATYKLGNVSVADGVLTVNYDVTLAPPGGAEFASTLIFSVDKTGVKKVVFVENGKQVGEKDVK
jgi:hypothetical protein